MIHNSYNGEIYDSISKILLISEVKTRNFTSMQICTIARSQKCFGRNQAITDIKELNT